MTRYLWLALLLSLVVSPVVADQPGTSEGSVKVKYGAVTTSGISSVISATVPVAKAAGSTATTLDAIRLYQSELHSVGVAVTATQAVALTDGMNRTTFSPAVTVAFAPSGTVKRLIAPISFPVTPYVILTIGSDAAYPVSYTSVTIQSW
jgi:hypothetical protein